MKVINRGSLALAFLCHSTVAENTGYYLSFTRKPFMPTPISSTCSSVCHHIALIPVYDALLPMSILHSTPKIPCSVGSAVQLGWPKVVAREDTT
uniref:Putative secreted protein n=1 Tax=Anopheles triannulatus TaxID=58253 RepID=A0A2M4B2V6_9DIPT